MNDGTCERCHGTGTLHRQDCGAHGISFACPDCAIDYYDDDAYDCVNCNGEGFVYGCSWDWQCDTYDEGEGTCLCTSRCDWCNPVNRDPALDQVMAEALRSDAT